MEETTEEEIELIKVDIESVIRKLRSIKKKLEELTKKELEKEVVNLQEIKRRVSLIKSQ